MNRAGIAECQTVGELIDALSKFKGDTQLEIKYEEAYFFSEYTHGTYERESDTVCVIDLESRIVLEPKK